jgi:hypothetical protein
MPPSQHPPVLDEDYNLSLGLEDDCRVEMRDEMIDVELLSEVRKSYRSKLEQKRSEVKRENSSDEMSACTI